MKGCGIFVYKSRSMKSRVASKSRHTVLPSLDTSLIFPFHLLPSLMHPTEFYFCFFHLLPSPVNPTKLYFCFFPGSYHFYLVFEQHHNHVQNVDTNRHSICNLYRLHMYGVFLGSWYTTNEYFT